MHHRTPQKLIALAAVLLVVFFATALTLLSHGASYAMLVNFDRRVDAFFVPFRSSPDSARFMLALTYLANPEMIIAFQACLLAIVVIVHRKRIAGLFLGGIILGEVAALFFKDLLARSRPAETVFAVARHGYSFPSGHALLGTLFYGCICFFSIHILRRKWLKVLVAIFFIAVIFLIGLSRVFLEVHWATDVIGGWVLGASLLCLVISIFSRIHRHTNGERVTDLSHGERAGLVAVSLALGFFLVLFFIAHLGEVRSIL